MEPKRPSPPGGGGHRSIELGLRPCRELVAIAPDRAHSAADTDLGLDADGSEPREPPTPIVAAGTPVGYAKHRETLSANLTARRRALPALARLEKPVDPLR